MGRSDFLRSRVTEFRLFFHQNFVLILGLTTSKPRSNVNLALYKHGMLRPEFNNLAPDVAA
jgi:hypothetical protein